MYRQSQNKLDELGIDVICSRIEQGESILSITESIGIPRSVFNTWSSKPEFSARITESRTKAAGAWEEAAERYLHDAQDEFELRKARELGHHLRWRAAKIAPQHYGERKQVDVNDITPKTPEQMQARIRELMDKMNASADK